VDITNLISFGSTDGGGSWSRVANLGATPNHAAAGGLRQFSLPSAEVDAEGKVYMVWADCRFEVACSANDLVMSTSTDGRTWSPVVRIPVDPVGSGVDHFIPGLGVNRNTAGQTAHLA